MVKNSLSINELKEAFFSLKTSESPRYADINSDAVNKCFGEINLPLKYIFNLSLENGIFPEKMKVAKVTRLFKNSDPENITNYRPISVLSCFSKVLERIMHKRYTNIYANKNYYIQSGLDSKKDNLHTDHAIAHLNV